VRVLICTKRVTPLPRSLIVGRESSKDILIRVIRSRDWIKVIKRAIDSDFEAD